MLYSVIEKITAVSPQQTKATHATETDNLISDVSMQNFIQVTQKGQFQVKTKNGRSGWDFQQTHPVLMVMLRKILGYLLLPVAQIFILFLSSLPQLFFLWADLKC